MSEATTAPASTAPATEASAAPAPAAATAATPAPASTAPATETSATAPAAAPAAPATTEATAPPGAPEKYDFKAPEGIQLADAVIGKFSEVAKALNLPQESAQKVLSEVAPIVAKVQAEQAAALAQAWESETKADKEIGGDKLNANLAIAKKAMSAYFPASFVKFLNESGLGNHPDMVRGLVKAGKAVSQDSFVSGGSGATPMSTAAGKLYGKN